MGPAVEKRLDRLTTSLQEIGVQGAIRTSLMRFKHIEPHRTFSNYILTETARYIDFFHTEIEIDREGSVQSNHPELM